MPASKDRCNPDHARCLFFQGPGDFPIESHLFETLFILLVMRCMMELISSTSVTGRLDGLNN